MTGSGSSIIGVAPNQEKAVDIVKRLNQKEFILGGRQRFIKLIVIQ